jgi:hypothetical protein
MADDLMKDLLLFWKRGIVLYFLAQVMVYVVGLVTGTATEVINALTRAGLVGNLAGILMSWVVMPILTGWLISQIIVWIKK